jgi:hypothetical protein
MKLFRVLAPLVLAAPAVLAVHETRANAGDAIGDCITASTDGQTLRKEGKLLAARDRFVECESRACPAVVRTHCASWAAEVDPLVPSVVVRAQDAHGLDLIDAHLTIDGKPGKLDGNLVQLDPGTHTVAVEARDGGGQKVQKVLLASGEHARLVVVRFDPPAAAPRAEVSEPPPATRHVSVGAWILGGVGLAALGSGVYFIVAATSDRNHLAATCAPYCSNAATQSGRTDVLAGDVLFAVGGTALGAALIWAFAFPETTESTAATSGPRFVVRPVAGGAVTGLSFRW